MYFSTNSRFVDQPDSKCLYSLVLATNMWGVDMLPSHDKWIYLALYP